MKLSQAFIRVVRRILRREGKTVRDLAKEVEMPERTVYEVLDGKQKVGLDQAADIAENGLDMKASEVVELAENEGENLGEGRT